MQLNLDQVPNIDGIPIKFLPVVSSGSLDFNFTSYS